jgi:hypothetical protein
MKRSLIHGSAGQKRPTKQIHGIRALEGQVTPCIVSLLPCEVGFDRWHVMGSSSRFIFLLYRGVDIALHILEHFNALQFT